MNNHVNTCKVDVNFAATPLLARVDRIAQIYHTRNKWSDRDDLIQVARITAISAVRLWDPFRGTPLQAYVGSAVRRALWGHILQARTVTHNPSREPAPRDTDITLHEQISADRSPCREAIASALAGNDIAYRALILGELPREISERSGIPVVVVYAAIARGRRAIRDSAVCARVYESLGMECSPLVWHDPTQLFQAACRSGAHKPVCSPKLLKSLLESRLGVFPAEYKLPHGFAARMRRAHAMHVSRQISPDYMPDLEARLAARKACTPAKYAELWQDLRKALAAAQGSRCTQRIWCIAELLEQVCTVLSATSTHTHTYYINAGEPGKSYRDRWQTTACTILAGIDGVIELRIGRGDYGRPTTVYSVYTHIETLRTYPRS